MPQVQLKISGVNDGNISKLKDVGMDLTGVQWININGDNIVVTYETVLNFELLASTFKAVDESVTIAET